eukprot:TRINITY_DN1418_c0_g1_i1.p1 TRINITY_DN1418_c0_g1~~TRINITY_DN1418_c0_g1_i1.p1  ORF type:complete len:802 (+),score=26.67 TRINITY_DN1418_c0_g1_i1:2-2407(+)
MIVELYPTGPPFLTPPPPRPSHGFLTFIRSVSLQVITQGVEGWKRGKAGSRAGSGLSPDMLRKCLKHGQSMGSTLVHFVQVALSGELPASLRSILTTKTGIALRKDPDDASKIRPVGVSETLTRLASRVGAFLERPNVSSHFEPAQKGLGAKKGAESINHTLTSFLQENLENPDFAVVSVDARNFFNSVSRPHALEQIRAHLPNLYRWAAFLYGDPSVIRFGRFEISESQGGSQGDPIAGIFCCAAVQPVLLECLEVPGLAVMAYQDDWYLAGSRDALNGGLEVIANSGPERGLFVNAEKTRVYSASGEFFASIADLPVDAPLATMATPSPEGIVTLGMPRGSPEFVRAFWGKKRSELSTFRDRLLEVDDVQSQLLLLRSCASFCRLVYHTRCMAPPSIREQCSWFDRWVLETVSLMTGITQVTSTSYDKTEWMLPIRLGGKGFLSSLAISPAAFISSAASCLPEVRRYLPQSVSSLFAHIRASIPLYNAQVNDDEALPLDLGDDDIDDKVKSQKILTGLIHKHARVELMGRLRASPIQLRRFKSVSSPHAQAYLRARPLPLTKLNNAEMILALRTTTGLPVVNVPAEGARCPSCAHHQHTRPFMLTPLGHHLHHCQGADNTRSDNIRHSHITEVLLKGARRAGLTAVAEDDSAYADSELRPDVSIYFPNDTTDFDVSVVSPLQKRRNGTLQFSATETLSAVNRRNDEKIRKYAALATANHRKFFAFALDSLGTFHPLALDCIRRLGHLLAVATGTSPSAEISNMATKISVGLMRSIARRIQRMSKGLSLVATARDAPGAP